MSASPGDSGHDDTVSDDDLLSRFGPGRHPERPLQRTPPPGTAAAADPDVVDALGRLSAALEVVEEARGLLYAFHRRSGEADLGLQEALSALRACGDDAAAVADEVDAVLVGRDTNPDGWTYELVEFYDGTYWSAFRAAEQAARERLGGGVRHLFEARMQHEERQG